MIGCIVFLHRLSQWQQQPWGTSWGYPFVSWESLLWCAVEDIQKPQYSWQRACRLWVLRHPQQLPSTAWIVCLWRACSSSFFFWKIQQTFCGHEIISSPATLTVCLLAPAIHTFTIINHSWVISWEKRKKEKSASSAHRTTSESADVLCCYNYRIFNEIRQSLVPAFGRYFFPASLISLNFIIKLSSFKLC